MSQIVDSFIFPEIRIQILNNVTFEMDSYGMAYRLK